MNIREYLKTNRTIRKIGKRINISRQFKQDARDFSNCYIEKAEDNGDYRYSIMLIVHSLEKGMCFTNPRPFGFEKIKELMHMLNAYPNERRQDFEYQLGISVLFAWKSFFIENNWQKENMFNEVTAFLKDKHINDKIVAGSKHYYPEYRSDGVELFEELFLNRHSVRDFQERRIDLCDVEFALKCFVETPTACNRQMCRVIYITSPEVKELLNNVVIGIPGFNKKTVQYFIITYDLASFAYSGERQQGLFNAGLCAMNFIYGLHAKGIGTCCLQWSNKYKEDVEVRSKLNIYESERIGIVIGAGYYLDDNLIPCSARRNTNDIFKIV